MNKILSVYKPVGLTPLELINQVKKIHPEYEHEKITYAGRLDPLAHGVMLLLIGDAIAEKDEYLHLNKTYEFEILTGIETDTYDVLGLLQTVKNTNKQINVNKIVNIFVNEHLGKYTQSYPPYSSKTVQGKPLFEWAKEDRLHEIEMPSHNVEIFSFKQITQGTLSAKALERHVLETISLVQGDFRQQEIAESWKKFFKQNKQTEFQILRFTIDCSSGTYVRSLAHSLGTALSSGAIVLEIKRTKVGEYDIKDALTIANH